MSIKKGRYEEWEEAYIKAKWEFKSDADIAEHLGRDTDAITRKRKYMGLIKADGRPSHEKIEKILELKPEEQTDRELYKQLRPSEKKKLFQAKFEKTKRYDELTEILTDDELELYQERFLDYMFTFETILTHEEDTLHLLILELIRGHRLLASMKAAKEAAAAGGSPIGAGIDILNRQYKECVDNYDRLMKSLNATREQRLKQHKETEFSLVTVVQALGDDEVRERVGKQAALIAAAEHFVRADMKEKNFLLD